MQNDGLFNATPCPSEGHSESIPYTHESSARVLCLEALVLAFGELRKKTLFAHALLFLSSGGPGISFVHRHLRYRSAEQFVFNRVGALHVFIDVEAELD